MRVMDFCPRQLTFKGSRLVYSRGIVTLAIFASLLIVLFQANVTRMIPLYAIGVFLSFTLSQTGMARRWWKSGHLKKDESLVEPGSTVTHDRQWKFKMIINGFGAVCTFIVMIVFAVTKFKDGAWVIVLLVPVIGYCLLYDSPSLQDTCQETVTGEIQLQYPRQPAEDHRASGRCSPRLAGCISLCPLTRTGCHRCSCLDRSRRIQENPRKMGTVW